MTLQPDKLFRDKLENFQLPAPGSAWEKIENGLTKTNHYKLLMKIAAGVALLLVGSFILWPGTPSENVKLTSIKNNSTTNPLIEKKTNKEVITPSAISKQNNEKKNSSTKNRVVEKNEPLIAKATEPITENTSIPVVESGSTDQIAVIETPSVKANSSRTIVYTVEEVNSKYLRKKSPPDATSEVTKTSGIQKLMGLAHDLKNNNTGLGDLRQKKNEILALGFLSEKNTKTKN